MNLVPIDSAVHFGEIIPPGASVRVVGKAHPLNGGRIERYLEVGLTLEEMLREALEDRPDLASRRDFFVCIDGNPIEEFNWHRVRPKAGTTVTFLPRLSGGNALRTVLGVVVAIAAFMVAGPAGDALAGSAFGLAIGLSPGVASALIGGGIVAAGPVALDALFPGGDCPRPWCVRISHWRYRQWPVRPGRHSLLTANILRGRLASR